MDLTLPPSYLEPKNALTWASFPLEPFSCIPPRVREVAGRVTGTDTQPRTELGTGPQGQHRCTSCPGESPPRRARGSALQVCPEAELPATLVPTVELGSTGSPGPLGNKIPCLLRVGGGDPTSAQRARSWGSKAGVPAWGVEVLEIVPAPVHWRQSETIMQETAAWYPVFKIYLF